MLSALKDRVRAIVKRLCPSPPTATSRNGVALQPGMRVRLPGGEGTHTVHRVVGHDLIEVKYSDGVVDSASSSKWNAVRGKKRRR